MDPVDRRAATRNGWGVDVSLVRPGRSVLLANVLHGVGVVCIVREWDAGSGVAEAGGVRQRFRAADVMEVITDDA